MTITGHTPLHGCTPTWAAHGNYAPRYGWLSKVQTALSDDILTFSRRDVTVRLGVGSSMVRAMRFWSMAFGLLETTSAPYPFGLTPTARGDWLLDPDTGADPYQEENATQWLLHWWLLSSSTCPLPTFHCLIADTGMSTHTRDDAIRIVRQAAERRGWKAPSKNQVSRDLTAFLAMYATAVPETETDARSATANRHVEEAVFNPWRNLRIVLRVPGDTDVFQVNRDAGRLAPKAVTAYACLDHAARTVGDAHSIALSRLHTDPSGPGRVLPASYRTLQLALEDAVDRHPELNLRLADHGDGTPHLYWTGTAQRAAARILASYYNREDGPPPAPNPTQQDVFDALFDL
ncbi:DUF4007 family protein [Streptomyces albidoflavus]